MAIEKQAARVNGGRASPGQPLLAQGSRTTVRDNNIAILE